MSCSTPLLQPSSPALAARIFAGVLVAASVMWVATLHPPSGWAHVGFWLAVCALGELQWLRLPLGRATMSMGSTANFAALLVLPVEGAVVAAAVACVAVELGVMRKPWWRAMFNSANTVLTLAASSVLLHALAPAGVFALRGGPLFAALASTAACYYLCNRAAVMLVLVLDTGEPWRTVWESNFGVRSDVLPYGAAMSLGVMFALLHEHAGSVAASFVLLPAWAVFQSLGHARTAGADARSVPAADDDDSASPPLARVAGGSR